MLFIPSSQSIAVFEPKNSLLYLITDWIMKIIEFVIPIITFVSIFLFKNRSLQIRISYIGIILIVAYYTSFILNLFISETGTYKINISAIFLFISLILFLLSIRAIKKDENLVKSLNRLR
jgi:EamA domain-containing membrane protein RarD